MANRNYFAHGGRELVIGGKLTFLPGAVVEGVDGLFDVSTETTLDLAYEPPEVADSGATTIAALRQNYNALLAALRKAGILAADGGDTAEAPHDPDGR